MFLQSLDFSVKNDISNLPINNKTTHPEEKSILKSLNSSGLANSMILNKKIVSLKHSLDALDHIPDYDEKLRNPLYMNNHNLFKNKKSSFDLQRSIAEKSSVESSLRNINSFNYSIIKNPGWGSIYEALTNEKPIQILKSPKKPSEREFELELGNENLCND